MAQFDFDATRKQMLSEQTLTKRFAKEHARSPSGLVHAHRRAAMEARMKSFSEQGPIIRAKADEMREKYPHMNIHQIYSIVGHDMGIL